MKKRNRLLPLLVAWLLAGCGTREQIPPTLATAATVSPPVTQPSSQTVPDTAEYYIQYVYPDQLREYYTGLASQWEAEPYLERQRSPLGAAHRNGNPLTEVGFALEDLDGDGFRELIIAAIPGSGELPRVFEVWSTPGEEPVLALCSGEEEQWRFSQGQLSREKDGQAVPFGLSHGALTASTQEEPPEQTGELRFYPFVLYAP